MNLIKKCTDLLVFICDSPEAVSDFKHIELVAQAYFLKQAHIFFFCVLIMFRLQLLLTLIESMLGPCTGNQEFIAKSDVVVCVTLFATMNFA